MTTRRVPVSRSATFRWRRALHDVRASLLRAVHPPPAPSPAPAVDAPIPEGDVKLRDRLVWQGARLDPAVPADIWRPWANAALRTRAEADAARDAVVAAGLHPHADDPKNWDSLLALGLILDRFDTTARVLDAGSTQYSRLLPWLYLFGYRALHGVDLTYEGPVEVGPIRYEQMDLTATTFADASFDAIACLSVIEHGVPVEAYLREASRLLKPGGLLITSTDFWCEPVDTAGREAYGVAAHIFTPAEIGACVAAARRHGLRPTGPLDLRCDERVVHWERMGLEFTFASFVLERAGPRPWSLLARRARRAVAQRSRARRSTSAT